MLNRDKNLNMMLDMCAPSKISHVSDPAIAKKLAKMRRSELLVTLLAPRHLKNAEQNIEDELPLHRQYHATSSLLIPWPS
jgi:hypothetical protein